MRIQAFIFSKDRAAQCRLLLESLARNCPGLFEPYILWKASAPEYETTYIKLQNESIVPGSYWVRESQELKTHFLCAMRRAQRRSGVMCIFTDDCIFYRSCAAKPEEVIAQLNHEVVCFSFRLGFNTTMQDYSTGRRQASLPVDDIYRLGEAYYVRWNWKRFHWTDNYGYIPGMDGCCYKAEDLIAWTRDHGMRTFRDWEGSLSLPQNRDRLTKPKMAAFQLSCVVNNPCNNIQWPPIPAGLIHPVGVFELNQKYLDGYVIDIDGFDFTNVQGAHQEFQLRFRKL